MSSTEEILATIAEAVANKAPGLVAAEIAAAAESSRDPTERAVLNLLAAYIEKEGADNVRQVGASLSSLLTAREVNPSAVMGLSLPASELTALVDQLQSAEADSRAAAAKTAKAVAIVAYQMVKKIAAAAIAAL